MNDSLTLQIDLFADLMVHLDDPFGRRDAVLASAGLDETSYRGLADAWRARLEGDETGNLAARFADAYAGARRKLREAAEKGEDGHPSALDPRFLSAEALPFREDAAKVARQPITESDPPPKLAEPEAPLQAPTPAAPSAPPPPPLDIDKRASFAGTMDIGALIPRDATPFVVPVAPVARLPVVPPPTAADTPHDPGEPRPHPPRPTGTADISGSIPRELLPFLAGNPPPAPPPPAPPPFAGTTDISAFIPRPATPFADLGPSSQRPSPAIPREPEAASAPPPNPVQRPPRAFSGTADISAFVPRAATPFTPPPGEPAPPPGPRKRLIRFDPQTGQPLPNPIWVDLPADPEGRK